MHEVSARMGQVIVLDVSWLMMLPWAQFFWLVLIHGGLGGHGESGEVCSVGNDGMVSCVEGPTNPELLSASAVFAVMTGVFTNA